MIMTAERQPSQEGFLSKVKGNILGRPLRPFDVQRALEIAGVQLPDDKDPSVVEPLIMKLQNIQVRKVRKELGLGYVHATSTVNPDYDGVDIPLRVGFLPSRFPRQKFKIYYVQDVLENSPEDPPNYITQIYKEGIAQLYQYLYQSEPYISSPDDLLVEKTHSQPNLIDYILGRSYDYWGIFPKTRNVGGSIRAASPEDAHKKAWKKIMG